MLFLLGIEQYFKNYALRFFSLKRAKNLTGQRAPGWISLLNAASCPIMDTR